MYREILYNGKYFILKQNKNFQYIPGCYEIIEKSEESWIYSEDAITELAVLEKSIRDFLLENGMSLVGIYREEQENKFKFYIMTYHVKKLEELNISPDLYQPYIEQYLSSFNDSYKNDVEYLNKNLKKRLFNGECLHVNK